MKRYFILLFSVIIVFMSACGVNDNSSDANEDNQENTAEKETKSETTEAKDDDEEETGNEEYDEETGEGYVEDFGYVKTLGIGYNDEVGIDGTDGDLKPLKFGSMELAINHMEIAEIQPDEDNKELFDGKDKAKMIMIDMEAKNKSEEDVDFYPSSSILVTDTDEQLEDSDMFLTDDIDGEFYGKVKKEGQAWWMLDDDEEINNVKMIINPPSSMDDWEDIGEEKRIEFEVLSYEDAKERDEK